MILLEPRRMTLRDYLDTLAEYEMPGSTINTKILGPPFSRGRVSITYAEPGLAVMRSDIQLADEMMLLKPQPQQPGDAAVDIMHYFAFASVVAGESISSISTGHAVETATGAQDLIIYFCNDDPTLTAYPPKYYTNMVLVQAGGWWLAEHLPGLAAQYEVLKEQGAIRHLYQAPLFSVEKLRRYRSNFDTPLSYGEESSRAMVRGFLEYCHSLVYSVPAQAEEKITKRPALVLRMNMLIEEIMSHIHQPLPSLAQMSARSGINVHTLRVNFMKHYGKPVAEFFAARQMAWAEAELRVNNATVKSVGYQIGYQNLSHFAANFKKYRGKFPGELTSATRH